MYPISKMKVIEEKLLYINSETEVLGFPNNFDINLPANYLRCERHQRIKLVLKSFEMTPRCFYLFNLTNTYFFLEHSGTIYPCVFPQGNYNRQEFIDNLKDAINATILTIPALSGVVECTDIDWFIPTGIITIKIEPIAPAVLPGGNFLIPRFLQIFNFQGQQASLPAYFSPASALNISLSGQPEYQPTDVGFQDFNEAIGGIATTDPNDLKEGLILNNTGTEYTMKSFFPAKLQTQENLYIRTNLPSDSLATKNFHDYLSQADEAQAVITNILGKIPIPPYDRDNPATQALTYVDANTDFFINLQKKWISSVNIFLTDDKSRLVPAPSKTALKNKYFQYSLTLGFQVCEDREIDMLDRLDFLSNQKKK